MDEQATRLMANYQLLVTLYKQGKFEEAVRTTDDPANLSYYYDASSGLPLEARKFDPDTQAAELRGRMRHPNDLQWAVGGLRESAQVLFEYYTSLDKASDCKDVILYYFRSQSLSYEVDDYFLSVGENVSKFLTDLAREITEDIEAYAAQFASHCAWGAEDYRELLKQILIVCLSGVNEYYRRHDYDEGLRLAKLVQQMLKDLPYRLNIKRGLWHGLVGLSSYVSGKILTAKGDFAAAEQEFLNSVEAYSESIWQKERSHFRRCQHMPEKEAEGATEATAFESQAGNHATWILPNELSRAVALRRSGLASSFGYGFQALVMGKVKDALLLSSLSRGIVKWNTGKIHSAYVDLIYFSAKRAENSSDRRVLVDIQRNLKRCYRVFQDLIPAAHYKYRALFQISLVYHYLARWYREKGLSQPAQATPKAKSHHTRDWNLRKAEHYWNWAGRHLLEVINDESISANKRLRAESMAILGHVWSNLGLLEEEFGRDGGDLLRGASGLLEQAWDEANPLSQSLCEVGLAKGAVGRAIVEYLLSRTARHGYLDETDETNPLPHDKHKREEIRSILNDSRQTLHHVLHLNQGNSMRVQATAYLRLTELALLQKEAWIQARGYYEEYKKISSQVEHDFCHRWAGDLENKLLTQSKSFVVTITPGVNFDKQRFDKDLEKYYTDYAVNYAAKEIEEDFSADRITERSSLSSYLTSALHRNFGITPKTAGNWIHEYKMFDHLTRVCSRAKDLRDYAAQGRKGKRRDDRSRRAQTPRRKFSRD
jgi:hypothetical protein